MELSERVYTESVSESNIGKDIVVSGFVANIRSISKSLNFIILSDWKGKAQVVAKTDTLDDTSKNVLNGITLQSIIIIKGTVQESNSNTFKVELLAKEISIISKSPSSLPIDMSNNTTLLEKRLDWRSLDLRKPENQAIFKIQSEFVNGAREYLLKNGFIQIFTPCLMGSASESGASTFGVAYFDKEAFLRQDPQLHRQLTIAGGIERVFDIGSSWRAELSHTTRHLCEHRNIAPEIAYITDEQDIMRLEENVITSGMSAVRERCEKELKNLNKEVIIPKKPFPEIRYPEIYDILKTLGKNIEYGEEHDWESEKLLANYIKEKYNNEFYFINRFPSKDKPFYIMRTDDDDRWTRAIDLVYKGMEISSGGQREHRYEQLIKNAEEKGLKNLKWFTDIFKYSVPPHGGFSVGVERVTKQMLDIENIREAVLFPRDPERLFP